MKPLQALKHCLNPKVIIGIGTLILFVYIFVPKLANLSWVLFILVCPLSMILMMRVIDDNTEPNRVYVCPECDKTYKDAQWAKKCAAWCKENHANNPEITKNATE